MTTLLPTDDNRHPIPALRYRPGRAHDVEGEAETAERVALDPATKLISIKTGVPVKIAFGGADVVADATGHGFFAGEREVIPVIDPATRAQAYSHVSIFFLEAGTVYVSERE